MIPGIVASHKYATGSGDPYWANVVLLMHMDDTGLTDVKSHTVTIAGNATRSATQSKFGGYGCYVDGAGDYLSVPTSTDFSLSGDFTIEAFVRPTDQTNNYASVLGSGKTTFGAGANFFMCYGAAIPTVDHRKKVSFGNFTYNPLLVSTTSLSLDTWYHIAVSRSGSSIKLFVDGAQEASATNSATFDFSDTKTMIGGNGWDGAASYFAGYIDELRITKAARYTTGFSAPTAAFPEF